MTRKNLKIAICEPDEDLTRLVRNSLGSEFDLTEILVPSRTAAEKACEEGVDLVLCDLNSRTFNGLALAQWMSSSTKNQIKRTPFIGLAGVLTPATEKLLSEIGMSIYISRRPASKESFLIDAKIAMGIISKNSASRMTEDLAIKGFIRVVQDSIDRGGSMTDAESSVATKLEKHPQSPLLWTYLGGLRLEEKDHRGAELGAKKALIMNPSFLPAMNLMAKTAVLRGDIADALKWMEKASKISPLNILRHIAVGEIHLANGRLAAAEEKFKRSLKLDPDSLDAKMGLAKTYMELGVPEGKKLVDEMPDPNLMASQANLRGILLSMAGQQEDALRFYVKTIKYLPTSSSKEPLVRYNMALALLKSGDYTKAVSELEKGMSMKPTFVKGGKLLRIARLATGGKLKLRYFTKQGLVLKSLGLNKESIAFLRCDDSGMTTDNDQSEVATKLKNILSVEDNPKVNHLLSEIANITSGRDTGTIHEPDIKLDPSTKGEVKSRVKIREDKQAPSVAFAPFTLDEDMP